MKQSQGLEQSNKNQKQNVFYLPKDVLCPNHQHKKIEWIDLSITCENRLYCSQCKRPQNEFIFKYEEIYKKIGLEVERIDTRHYAQELEKVKQIFFSQWQQIEYMLQELHNQYQDGIKSNLYHCFVHPFTELNYQQLHELSECLSKKLIFEHNSFQFIPQVSVKHDEKLEKIIQCIKLYQNCAIQIDQVGLMKEKSILDLTLCRNLKQGDYEQQVTTAYYELAIKKDFEFEINCVDMSWDECYIVIADKNPNNEIQIWDIDKQNMKLNKLLARLQGHSSQIIQLQKCWDSIISIDQNSKVILWVKQNNHRAWILGREFNGHMQLINCIEYHFYHNILAIGGDYLQCGNLIIQIKLFQLIQFSQILFRLKFIQHAQILIKISKNQLLGIQMEQFTFLRRQIIIGNLVQKQSLCNNQQGILGLFQKPILFNFLVGTHGLNGISLLKLVLIRVVQMQIIWIMYYLLKI